MTKNIKLELGNYDGEEYRVCYRLDENGKMDYSKKFYQFDKYCDCKYCSTRLKMYREPSNRLAVTTNDPKRFDEAVKLIKNYECNSKVWNREYKFICLTEGLISEHAHSIGRRK